MKRRSFLKTAGLFSAGLFSANFFCTKQPSGKPNILFILADDLGWAQLSCYGSKYYQTPNIDRLASQGMLFTDAYAACPVCSPTRASIMTGKYPARLHLTDYIPGAPYPYAKLKTPDWQKFLPLKEVTVAEIMKSAGYATAAFGKWHLSIDKKPPKSLPFNPDKQGFDEYVVTYKPTRNQDPEKDAHNVELITRHSLKFMEQQRKKRFFLYVSHNSIHAPLKERSALVEKYKHKPGAELPENNSVLGAMIETLDRSVGSLLKKLDELQIADNTMVIFFSDNGGLLRDAAQTPLRGGKAQLYEGGIRVPLIVRWPGVVQPGSKCSTPVSSIDFLPTFSEVARRQKLPANVDGKSIVSLLKGQSGFKRKAIFWHYPHYHSAGIVPSGAVREGNYKLIEWYDTSLPETGDEFELYDLKNDIGESKNLVGEKPGVFKELREDLEKWRREVGAQMPAPNPNYDEEKAAKSR